MRFIQRNGRRLWRQACLLLSLASVPIWTLPASGLAQHQAQRADIAILADRAIEEGNVLVSAALTRQSSAWERRVLLSQMSMLIYYGRGCDAVKSYFEKPPELMGAGIEKIVELSARESRHPCYAALAPLMLQRWNDPIYGPSSRIVLRYKAGAMLDLVGIAEGKSVMHDAEAQLMTEPDSSELWRARYAVLGLYSDKSRKDNYLLYLADRIMVERPLMDRSLSALIALADIGRCDLVERIVNNGAASCDRFRNMAGATPAGGATPESPPPLTTEMLNEAVATRDPQVKIFRLIEFAKACHAARNAD